MVYTLTLSPALDYVMKTEKISNSDINRCYENEIYFGGKGINVSTVLSRLGINSIATGFLAGFTGKELERMLKNESFESDFVFLKNGRTRINVKLKADGEYDFNTDAPCADENEINELISKLEGINDGDFLVLSGAVPKNNENIYERTAEAFKDRNINLIVDTTGKCLLNMLEYKPFLIKPNHHELAELFDKESLSDDEIISCAKILIRKGAKNVLVSLAERGAVLITENGDIIRTENAKGILKNSVGCGDSMLAGFIAGYIERNDFSFAMRLATACGNATAYSDSLAQKSEIVKILNRI